MRIVTTGGREFADRELVRWALRLLRPDEVAHGACGVETDRVGRTTGTICGADALVDEDECAGRHLPVCYQVDHAVDGPWPNAGPRRNQRMLDSFKPDLVIAFEGGRGTADCCRRATKMGIRVITARRDMWDFFVLTEMAP